MRLARVRPRPAYSGHVARREDSSIPTGRIRRTAQVGSVVGTQGARYAGTRAANLARSPEQASEALEQRHLEAAERMVETLGRMKGAAMKVGQLASFIDTEFLPPEYRELYQEQLATLRTEAPSMPWNKVKGVLGTRPEPHERDVRAFPRSHGSDVLHFDLARDHLVPKRGDDRSHERQAILALVRDQHAQMLGFAVAQPASPGARPPFEGVAQS